MLMHTAHTHMHNTGDGAAMLTCFDTYLEQKLWTNGHCSGSPANTTNVRARVCVLCK
jgi:hypothetical protein